MTFSEISSLYYAVLVPIYGERESRGMLREVLRKIVGEDHGRKHDELTISIEEQSHLKAILEELKNGRPLQYVLNEAHFYGLNLYVDENVLIPRPETEELVHWVVKCCKENHTKQSLKILDVGTGSGCIALALKQQLPGAQVYALDVCEGALKVAAKNAQKYRLPVNFIKWNILERTDEKSEVGQFDVIVSNPPYVLKEEAKSMAPHVLQHEPHRALFVEGKQAMQFYEAIADYALVNLKPGGNLFFEINESYGQEVKSLLQLKNYRNIELKKDLSGKDRMVRGLK